MDLKLSHTRGVTDKTTWRWWEPGLLEEDGVEPDFEDFKDTFYEDLDFEFLYANACDRIEAADVAQEVGIVYLAFDEWFKRFDPPDTSSYTEVHPIAREDMGPDTNSAV